MDFELSWELRIRKQEAYKFAVRELDPIAKEYDREGLGRCHIR